MRFEFVGRRSQSGSRSSPSGYICRSESSETWVIDNEFEGRTLWSETSRFEGVVPNPTGGPTWAAYQGAHVTVLKLERSPSPDEVHS